jgi:hypothetical protein
VAKKMALVHQAGKSNRAPVLLKSIALIALAGSLSRLFAWPETRSLATSIKQAPAGALTEPWQNVQPGSEVFQLKVEIIQSGQVSMMTGEKIYRIQ